MVIIKFFSCLIGWPGVHIEDNLYKNNLYKIIYITIIYIQSY